MQMLNNLIGLFKKLTKKHIKRMFIKCVAVVSAFIVLDIFGIFMYLFELDFTKYFQYPMYGNVYHYAYVKRYGKRNSMNEQSELSEFPEPLNNFSYEYRIPCKCKDESNSRPYITILVKSAIGNGIKREAIRRTWGYERRYSDINVRRIFLLGITINSNAMQQVIDEAAEHNDILQGDFVDDYYNNTLKTMMGIHWAASVCPRGHYYLFADDDYYISIRNVLRFIAHPLGYPENAMALSSRWHSMMTSKNKNSELYAGFIYQTRPIRQKFSKWYIDLEEYPYNKWPPYVTAGAYILSQNSLLNLYYTSLFTKLFRFDDVYLGIVAMKCYMNLTHCGHFHITRPQYNGPYSYRYVIASHGFDDPNEMQRIWNECHSAGFA